MRGLTDALRVELYGSGVNVTYVAPGWVRSNISESGAHGDLNQMNPKVCLQYVHLQTLCCQDNIQCLTRLARRMRRWS